MAKKRMLVKELTDEEILRIARIRVAESAASTFTQVEHDTQLSVERGVIWLIHWIEFIYDDLHLFNEVAANGFESVTAQVTKATKATIANGNDADLIQSDARQLVRSAAIGTDAGPLWYQMEIVKRFDYPMPIPFASQNIYAAVNGTDSADTHTVNVRIGYTIRKVSDEFFFRVAQALVG